MRGLNYISGILLSIFLGNILLFIILTNVLEQQKTQQLSRLRQEKEHELVSELRGRVESAYTTILYLYNTRGEKEAKETSKKIISNFRFGENNYIWVHQFSPAKINSAFMLVHAAHNLVNKDLSGLIDLERIESIYHQSKIYSKDHLKVSAIQPTDIFTEFNKVCLEKGEGVVPYYWPKIIDGIASKEGYRKVSFVKHFPYWNWVIGAGAYADHIDTAISKRAKIIKQQHKSLLARVFIILLLLSVITLSIVFIIIKNTRRARLKSLEEIHKQKEFIETVLNSLNDSICIIEAETYKVLGVNTAFCNEYSIDEKRALGKTCFEVSHHLKASCPGNNDSCPMHSTIKTGKSKTVEHTHYDEKERELYVEITTSPIFDEKGVVKSVVHVERDITEQKTWAKTIEQSNSDLEEAYTNLKNTQSQLLQQEKMASVGQLAAGVAHEINNPMGFINSNLGSLESYISKILKFLDAQSKLIGSLNEEKQLLDLKNKLKIDYITDDITELISESKEGAERVTEIVQNLKEFSRVDAAKISLSDVNECLESTLKIVWNELKYKCEVETDYSQLPQIRCNPQQLNQVFVNLLINAAQAIEKHGIISIKTWHEKENVKISISDTGCGIDPENIAKLFEPFFTTKDVGEGTGLGLSICFDIIKKHQGTIDVKSETGKGTSFIVSLPVKNDAH